MDGAVNPVVIAQAVARNIVPLVGILVFHWSTGNVLILYLLDTLLSMAVIIAGLASSFASPPDDEGVGGWILTRICPVARPFAIHYAKSPIEPKPARASEMHPLHVAARI